jgi:hypothetical protein
LITNNKDRYPLYKFITYDKVIELCKKYNLAFGIVGNYTGEIPKKCINQIKDYMNNAKTPRMSYYYVTGLETYRDASRIKDAKIAFSRFRVYEDRFSQYNTPKIIKQTIGEDASAQLENLSDIELQVKNDLLICAPISEMSVDDFKVTKHIPDPVVLAKCEGGFLIVTAWGVEASDPIVVNEINN